MKGSIIIYAALVIIILLAVTARFALANKGTLDVYLLIGQSNMSGRAPIPADATGLIDPQRCFILNVEGKWEPASNPLNKYSTVRKDLSAQHLNPGYSFAKKMLERNPKVKIGLVVNALGGSAIAQWQKGKRLYNEAVARTRVALDNGGTLKGILWHQGESDGANPRYRDELKEMIDSLYADLLSDDQPGVPFVAGQVVDRSDMALVNRMIAGLPSERPFTAVARSQGLKLQDFAHFDTQSQLEFGERYADAMMAVQADAKAHVERMKAYRKNPRSYRTIEVYGVEVDEQSVSAAIRAFGAELAEVRVCYGTSDAAENMQGWEHSLPAELDPGAASAPGPLSAAYLTARSELKDLAMKKTHYLRVHARGAGISAWSQPATFIPRHQLVERFTSPYKVIDTPNQQEKTAKMESGHTWGGYGRIADLSGDQGRGVKAYTDALYFNSEAGKGSYAYTVFDRPLLLEGLNVPIASGSPGKDRQCELRVMLRDAKTRKWHISSVWTIPGGNVEAWARPGSQPWKDGLWSNECVDFDPSQHQWRRVSEDNDTMLNALQGADEQPLEIQDESLAWADCPVSKNGMDGSGLYKDTEDKDSFRITTMSWHGAPLPAARQ
ncbi:sialate O-acetylesterase [Candidatus Sumerlaeota bacterium]